jgi:hypothetical protein
MTSVARPMSIAGRPLDAAARRSFDHAERLAFVVARRWPQAGLALASVLGASRNTLSRRWPPPRVTAELLAVDARQAGRIARRIAAQEARNRAVTALRAAGLGARLRPLVRWATPPGALSGPAILVTFHVGALPALGLGLDELPAPWVATGCGDLEPGGLDDGSAAAEGVQRRTALLMRRLAHLRDGGFVVLAADGELGGEIPIRCLGRRLPLRRGTFFLARESGAPLLPLVALWRRRQVELHCADADLLGGGRDEAHLAAALGDWLSALLRARPEQLTVGLLRRLVGEA